MIETDKQLLVTLHRSQTWHALVRLITEMVNKNQTSMSTINSEWEYLSESLRKEGRIEGFRMLLREIEALSNK